MTFWDPKMKKSVQYGLKCSARATTVPNALINFLFVNRVCRFPSQVCDFTIIDFGHFQTPVSRELTRDWTFETIVDGPFGHFETPC